MSEFQWVAIAAITILSSARITRLVTYDKFPPILWARYKYADWTDKHAPGWGLVAFCGYCASFWVTAAIVIWGDLAGVFDHRPAWGGDGSLSIPAWYLINSIFGASYVAAIVMAHDGDVDDEQVVVVKEDED